MTYKLERDSRIVIYKVGGFANRPLGGSVDVTLDALSEKDFKSVKEIIALLQNSNTQLKTSSMRGDFGYHVEIGTKDADNQSLVSVFSGRPFSSPPAVVIDLQNIISDALGQPRPFF